MASSGSKSRKDNKNPEIVISDSDEKRNWRSPQQQRPPQPPLVPKIHGGSWKPRNSLTDSIPGNSKPTKLLTVPHQQQKDQHSVLSSTAEGSIGHSVNKMVEQWRATTGLQAKNLTDHLTENQRRKGSRNTNMSRHSMGQKVSPSPYPSNTHVSKIQSLPATVVPSFNSSQSGGGGVRGGGLHPNNNKQSRKARLLLRRNSNSMQINVPRRPKQKRFTKKKNKATTPAQISSSSTALTKMGDDSQSPDQVVLIIPEVEVKQLMDCPRCLKQVTPVIRGEPSRLTHIFSAVLGLIGLTPVMHIPYWFNWKTSPVKRCSKCGAYLTEPPLRIQCKKEPKEEEDD